jgi:hypothetical protein
VLDELVAERARPQVVEQRRGRVGVVLADLAGQPAVQMAADRREPARTAVVLGLLVAQPHRLRRGVRGVGVQPGALNQGLLARGRRQRV